VPVGYAPVGYAPVPPATDRKAGSSSREHRDPAAPSWEEPRRLESYPTLKSRGAGGLPRPAVYAIVILLVGVGLFATPFILRGIGGGGGEASPTPAASASVVPTEEPSPTAEPTPEEVVYKVKKGDALGKIAAKYGVTVDQILAANPNIKNANQIAVGDKIIIPQPLPSEVVDGEVTPAP
jgi:LysM repeat protein